MLPNKFVLPVLLNRSADPQADLKRADELVSRALALDPNYWVVHNDKGQIFRAERRFGDAIVEYELARALDPSSVEALGNLGFTHSELGEFEKAIEFFDKALPSRATIPSSKR